MLSIVIAYRKVYNYRLVISDEILKHLSDYKKYWKHVTLETDYYHPIKISGDNGFVQFEYWRAPSMPDEIDRERFEEVQKETVIKEEIKPEPEVITQVEKKIEPEPEVKPKTKPTVKLIPGYCDGKRFYMVKPICKPKHQPYKKYQWSQDMEEIQDKLEKHRLNRETKKDRVKQVVEYKGFVFFINKPLIETELSYIKIKSKNGAQIIQQALPEGYVLIAWYKWGDMGWIAQAVKKAV